MSVLELKKKLPPCEFCGRPTDAEGLCTQYIDARIAQAQRPARPPATSVPSPSREEA